MTATAYLMSRENRCAANSARSAGFDEWPICPDCRPVINPAFGGATDRKAAIKTAKGREVFVLGCPFNWLSAGL